MTTPHVLTDQDKDQIRALRAGGMTFARIARKFGVTAAVAYYHAGQPSTTRLHAALSQKYRDAIDRVYALADDVPISQAIMAVARETGIKKATLYNLAEVYRLVEQARPAWENWSDESLLRAHNHNQRQIAALAERLETRETAAQNMEREIKRRRLAVLREEEN